MDNNQFYVPCLEWEATVFPLEITNIQFEKIEYGIPATAIIRIDRDNDYKLCGKIETFLSQPMDVEEDIFVGKGNIIKQDTVTGNDKNGNTITLSGCILGNLHSNSWERQGDAYGFDIDIHFDALHISFIESNGLADKTRLEWFVCPQIPDHFDETTYRNLNCLIKRQRVGIDENDKAAGFYSGSSSSRDHIQVNLPEVKVIIAKVPKVFLAEGMQGICFEFRSVEIGEAYNQLVRKLKHFISFILGNKLTHVGYSEISGEVLTQAFFHNVSRLYQEENKSAMPPVKFNRKYEWGNFSWLTNQLLPTYLKLAEILALNQVLSRYWIAKRLPVGVNLPLLANALEILAGKYLKHTGKFKMENMPSKQYLDLIKEELEKLEKKLSGLECGNVMLNKIKGANQKVPSEKINFFFCLLGLDIGDNEKAAINLRNKMAHSSRDYKDDETAYDDLILTRTYEVLFNRVILKLLGYKDYYIDYTITGCPSRQVNESSGKE
ncbi:hypothetical protein [Ferruginibacter sp.]